MQFTLKSRFRGAFLGAALGEVFGTIALESNFLAESNLSLRKAAYLWQFNPFAAADLQKGESSSRPIINLANDLVQPRMIRPQGAQSPVPLEQDRPKKELDSAIDLLPLILLCHESQTQIQQSLLPRLAHLPSSQQMAGFATALIVSRILQEQFGIDRDGLHSSFHTLHTLIEELHPGRQSVPIAQENFVLQDSKLLEQLQQVQSWLEQGIPLSMLPEMPSPIAAALYGLLKTPTVFPLALVQTLRLNSSSEAAALVGLFAGAHLSEAGLPIGWRLAIDRYQSGTLKQLWGISSVAELLELSDRLWATWSGAFQPDNWQAAASTVTAIPHLVRPR